MPDSTVPIAIIVQSTDSAPINSRPFKPPLRRIIGIANRNEKRAAVSRSNPRASAAVMVIPEREVPGIRASA